MRAHVLLILLHELGKRDKMQGLSSILSLFRNEFNKFNKTRINLSYDIKITLKSHFWHKNVIILTSCTQRCYGSFLKICKSLVVYRFYWMALLHSQMRLHVINIFMSTSLQFELSILRNKICSSTDFELTRSDCIGIRYK